MSLDLNHCVRLFDSQPKGHSELSEVVSEVESLRQTEYPVGFEPAKNNVTQ